MRNGIRQVAQMANVSTMTVSRVARGQDALVHEETRKRVMAAMKELNYVPVRYTTQNRHVDTYAIGLVPYYVNAAMHEIDTFTYQGVVQQAYKHGYDLLVMLRDEAAWMANRKEVRFLDRRSDGFIFVSPGVGEWTSTLEALVENKIPSVVCYHRDVPDGVAWVDPDNESVIDLMLDCLISAGHRTIAYLAGPITVTSDQPRLVLYGGERAYDDRERDRIFRERIAAMSPGGIRGCVLTGVDVSYQVTNEVLQSIIDSGATAVLCGDYVALQLWTLAEERGLTIPGDLSIIGIDDSPLGGMRGLTSVHFRYSDVGAAAVDAWVDLKAGKSSAEASRKVAVSLVSRRSVSRPQSLT